MNMNSVSLQTMEIQVERHHLVKTPVRFALGCLIILSAHEFQTCQSSFCFASSCLVGDFVWGGFYSYFSHSV